MTKLEIPEGYSKNIYVKSHGGSCYEVIFNPDDKEEVFNESDSKLLPLLPAMAEEIKRLRSVLESVENITKGWRSEIEMLYEARGTFPLVCLEDKADEIEKALAALAKPQGAQETDKAELKHLLKLAYGIMGCHHEYSVATGWKGHTCPVCSDGQHTENIRKIQVALGYLKDEPEKPTSPRRPFDLEAALRGEKVVTRGGKPIDEGSFVRLPHLEGCSEIRVEIGGLSYYYDLNGKFHGFKDEHHFDLFMERGV